MKLKIKINIKYYKKVKNIKRKELNIIKTKTNLQ
jgi:hypothetical protein